MNGGGHGDPSSYGGKGTRNQEFKVIHYQKQEPEARGCLKEKKKSPGQVFLLISNPSRSILLSPEVNECEAWHTSFRNSHPNN